MTKISKICAKKWISKIRLVAGNCIWSEKIRPKSPLSPLESPCQILWHHLKKLVKKSLKNIPPPPKMAFFWEGGESGDRWDLWLSKKNIFTFFKNINFCVFFLKSQKKRTINYWCLKQKKTRQSQNALMYYFLFYFFFFFMSLSSRYTKLLDEPVELFTSFRLFLEHQINHTQSSVTYCP